MRFFLLLFWFFFISSIGFSQTDWQALQMGSSVKKWQNKPLTDISNPNSLEETAFVLNEKVSFFGLESEKVELFFYNDRLFSWRIFLNATDWDKLKEALKTHIDANGKIDEKKKEGYWYYGDSKRQFAVFTHDNQMTVYYTDSQQKEFHWQDLFKGTLFYVLLTIFLGIALYLFIAWLWVSYCPKCRSFSMQHVKRETQTKAINTGTLLEQTLGGGAIEMRFKHKDTYRCKKCGYEKTYKSKS